MKLTYHSRLLSAVFEKPIALLLGIWLVYLLFLLGLQMAGYSFGFNIWPMGEDRNWLDFMYAHGVHSPEMMHEFWLKDDRNPLSPWWWWLAISPFIDRFDTALYLVRKCIDPFLAITTYLLLNRLGRGKNPLFAFSTALVVLMWNFSAYYEQILWNFLGALGFTLLAIYFYCGFIDEKRQGSGLALALICYLIAIATYTLQCGAIIAVAYLALTRPIANRRRNEKINNALIDVGFFIAIFVIYSCIWFTVKRSSSTYFHLNWEIFFKQFFDSIKIFIYAPAYTNLKNLVLRDFSKLGIIIGLILSFSFYGWILQQFNQRQKSNLSRDIIYSSLIIMLAIIVPTIIVESTSVIWAPGTRSAMVQQVWQPLFYVTFIFSVINALPISHKKASQCIIGIIALLLAITTLGGLDYNHRLVLRTHYQRVLAQSLQAIGEKMPAPRYYIINMLPQADSFDINTIPFPMSNYAKTMLKDPSATIRIIESYPNPAFAPFWRVQFKENKIGIINGGPFFDSTPVPYKNAKIIFFDGQKAWVPTTLNKQDFKGLEVDWDRKHEIQQ